MDTITTRYRSHTELNDNTPSTGTITCYDGIIEGPDDKEPWESQFIEIEDCHNKARLHRASYDTQEDWLRKVITLKDAIDKYYEHLCTKHLNTH